MINVSKLNGLMAENGISKVQMAKRIGISYKTFYNKLKKGILNSNEIEIMINELHIENPIEIFFNH